MLTGDDKSTWFITLRQGWRMLYVPDVRIRCLEEMPGNGFVSGSFGLMRRWYGNMARSNLRARRLGPARIGFFTWFCLLDQRVSPWTTLTGPAILMHAVLDGDARGTWLIAAGCWPAAPC
jgi:glycosyltransferase Alg8